MTVKFRHSPDIPTNEAERLAALYALKVLDTPAEARFDRITRVAQRHFDVPIALVSLVDEERQWFKSCQGLDATETSRDISFCGHAILNDAILIVPDATEDPRFADNPLVTGSPKIRFYAGTPLHAPGGERVGTLCVIDTQLRAFGARDITMLRDLADCVEEELVRVTLEDVAAILAEERRRLSDVLEGANVGTWEWNLLTGELSMDERSAKLIGFGLAEFMPASMETWINRTHPEDREGAERLLKEHLAGQSDHYECDARLRHRDGHWVWLHSSSRVTSRTADGNPLLMSGTHRDVTAQKNSHALELEARAQAEAANQAKSMFLANMSHEIRSPLNAILGLAYLLEQANLDGVAREMVRKIRSSGSMLLDSISDILDMAKIEAGQLKIEQAPFDLWTIVDNVATTLGTAIGGKDIEVTIAPLPAGVRGIVGDATRLQAVLINLASNAAKFTQAGSIVVGIESLSRADGSDWLRFSFRDTGIGIPPEQQSAVFEAFVQADLSTTRRFGGTGLGLTISSETVKLMGGEIGLISAPGQGSEFWFTLPLKRVAAAQDSS